MRGRGSERQNNWTEDAEDLYGEELTGFMGILQYGENIYVYMSLWSAVQWQSVGNNYTILNNLILTKCFGMKGK